MEKQKQMKKRTLTAGTILLCLSAISFGQNSIKDFLHQNPQFFGSTASVYYCNDTTDTPAPKDFIPFHIDHIARHGSRTHDSKSMVPNLYKLMNKADSLNLLTREGKLLRNQIDTIYHLMNHRWGDLTPLGARQHRDMARRMYHRFRPAFTPQDGKVTLVAQSTTVPRSMASMAAFVAEMRGYTPTAEFSMDPSNGYDNTLRFFKGKEYQQYLSKGSWKKILRAYQEKHTPTRLIDRIFKKEWEQIIPDPITFMTHLYALTIILPNTDYDISLYPWFTEEEKFDLWSANNLSQYLRKANSIPGKGLPVAIAKPLLKDMLVTSQAAIDGNGVEANLRFAHGENTIPLLALLGIENAAVVEADPEKVAEVWQDFKYNPMATNIQWILYKNTDGKILVKVLFNEQEIKLPIDSEYAPYYDWELFQKYLARELIEFSSEILNKAFDETNDVDDLMQEAEGKLFEISQRNLKKDVTQIDPVLSEAIRQIQIAANRSDGLSGLQTGFHDIDKITSGWQNSDLIIIAARPAMGKTAFVLSMAKNMAVSYNTPVAIFSLEMSNVQLVNRLIINTCEIPGDKIKSGQLAPFEWERLMSRIEILRNAPIYIDDTPSLSVFELRTKARRLVREHGIKIIIIDYLQLMNASGMSFGSREQEVSTISRSLKQLAKELQIPIIALSQLNRSVESRGNDKDGKEGKRPQLSDLRESGAIEQDADMVCFIHRPEYYTRSKEDANGNSIEGLAEFIIAKHRSGATDTVNMKFVSYLARFQNYDEDTRLTDFSAPVTSKFNTPDTSTPSATPLSGNPDFLNPPGSSNNDIPF